MIGSYDMTNLSQLKSKIQTSWNKLTDDDFDANDLKRQQIVLKLQERYGYKKEQAENALKDWEIKNRSFL
ncbi:MAG: hypothetical protein B7Y48_11540 [Methylophilales bacterium 28-44-11]|nr:MAG: hypothetical protein B7Y48_11540 [Methylophilales bacterium 28-44-11]OYY94374.1 MAG: hypothetical protein B7Y32_07980 [Methylophilales bacterium 16-45-7]